MSTNQILSNVWSFCNTLRDDGFTVSFLQKGLFWICFFSATIVHGQKAEQNHSVDFYSGNAFVENKGQIVNQFHKTNSDVKFLLQANGLNVQLKKNSFSYDTYTAVTNPRQSLKTSSHKNELSRDSALLSFHRVDVEFVGANPSPQIETEEQAGNYLVYQKDRQAEGMIVHQYNRIIYKQLYSGIDLVFDIHNATGEKGFEYYFIVSPGADAKQIRLRYKGAKTKLENNSILIKLAKGSLRETIPANFLADEKATGLLQLKDKQRIAVQYRQLGPDTYGFRIPGYDRSKTLIIDPTPDRVWGTYYGGSINDWAYNITKDGVGNILVCGSSNNPNLATTGAYQNTLMGYADAMLGKFQSDGKLLWMTYFGGESEEIAYGVCTDGQGNIFIAGITDSKTGISTPGSYQNVPGNTGYGRDAFIAKFTPAGNRLWATYYGGLGVDYIHAIRSDANGNVYVAGWTSSADAIASSGAYQQTYGSDAEPTNQGDGFVARFDNNGNRIWATYYGSQFSDTFVDLAVENSGKNIYVSGTTSSPQHIASPGAFQPSLGGNSDMLLVKFDAGGKRVWATYYGGNGAENAEAIACDNQDNVIIGGMATTTSGLTTSGSHQPGFGGGARDGIVIKFSSGGNRLWATYYGGSGEEWIYGLTTDNANNIILAASTYSTNNIATPNAYQPALLGSGAVWTPFVAKLDANSKRIWGTYYGFGNMFGGGEARHAVTDNAGNVFVCGVTMATDGVASCNAVQQNWGGNQDMFIALLSETISPTTVSVSISANQANGVCAGTPVTFTATSINGGTNPSYQWKVNGMNTGGNTATFTSATLKNGDQVSCTVTSNSPCVTSSMANSNVITLSMIPSVVPSVTITANTNGNICKGTTVTFTATAINSGNAPSYQWKVNGNNTGTNSPSFSTNTLDDGDIVHCILTNPSSCNPITSAASNNLVMRIDAGVMPLVNIAASANGVCKGTTVTFTASVTNGGTNPVYQWKVNGTVAGNKDTYSTGSLSNNDTVQCFVIPDNSVCAASGNAVSNKIVMQVFPLPDFTIQPLNPTITRGDTIQLSVTGASNVSVYSWTPAQAISNPNSHNPFVWPAMTQTYNLEATSLFGCKRNKAIKVNVITEVYVPTAFTPNNDGKNDVWAIKGLEIYPHCSVTVFNRWGQIVYQSTGYQKPWDGSFKRTPHSTGTFVYLIDLNNGREPIKGTVTLIN